MSQVGWMGSWGRGPSKGKVGWNTMGPPVTSPEPFYAQALGPCHVHSWVSSALSGTEVVK